MSSRRPTKRRKKIASFDVFKDVPSNREIHVAAEIPEREIHVTTEAPEHEIHVEVETTQHEIDNIGAETTQHTMEIDYDQLVNLTDYKVSELSKPTSLEKEDKDAMTVYEVVGNIEDHAGIQEITTKEDSEDEYGEFRYEGEDDDDVDDNEDESLAVEHLRESEEGVDGTLEGDNLSEFSCIECHLDFNCQESLEVHMYTYHMAESDNMNDSGKEFRCLVCSYIKLNRKGMRMHLHQHTSFRPFKCTLCPMKFLRQSTLKFHMRTHKKRPKIDGAVGRMLQLDNLEFFRQYRVTKKLFASLLRKIEEDKVIRIPRMVDQDTYKRPISTAAALLMTLSYIGRRPSFGEIADTFGTCESACHRVIWIIIYYFAQLSKNFIQWRSTEVMKEEEQRFRDIYHFPGIVGVVGTCRIPIRTPDNIAKEKFTHWLSTSVSLQIFAVCNSRGKFTFVSAGFPGGEREDYVLHLTPLGRKLSEDPTYLFDQDKYHLIGDGRYTLRKSLMVPFKSRALNPSEGLFNKRLHEAAGIIEQSFYYLKGRFKRLELVESGLQNITPLLLACCVLHNLALSSQEDLEYLIEELDEFALPTYIPFDGSDIDVQAIQKRNRVMHML